MFSNNGCAEDVLCGEEYFTVCRILESKIGLRRNEHGPTGLVFWPLVRSGQPQLNLNKDRSKVAKSTIDPLATFCSVNSGS
jgi:hypothetical protein